MIEHVHVDFVQFDTILQTEPKPYNKKAGKKVDIVGRGGTSFYPVMELAHESDYDGLVIFTDGEAPFPPKPKYRMLWAVCQNQSGVQFPYGKKVVIEAKK